MVMLNQLAAQVDAEKWVLCLKHGTKYSVEYVNKLYNMTKRNMTVPFRFACITEDPTGLYQDIVHIPLPTYDLDGWWFKIWVFSDELPIHGEILFIDLDVVIINNIDDIWLYNPDKFCIIRDFIRSTIPGWSKFNSSVFKFSSEKYNYLWDILKEDLTQTNQFHGDQDFLNKYLVNNFEYFPDIWMQSYKWEIRDRNDLIKSKSGVNFSTKIEPNINKHTKILIFHGEPKPSEILDNIIINNWV